MTSIFGFAIQDHSNAIIFTVQMVKVNLNVRVEKSEMEILENYAQQTGRTKTDIIREYIRSLAIHRSPHHLSD